MINLFAPNLLVQLLNALSNTIMLRDMLVASVFLAFSVLAIANFKTLKSYAPITSFQSFIKIFGDFFSERSYGQIRGEPVFVYILLNNAFFFIRILPNFKI